MKMLLNLSLAAALLLAAFAQAHEEHAVPFGAAVDTREANRVVRIEMSDAMRFSPERVDVRRGEAVRFVVVNKGRLVHEMVIGRLEALKEHAARMAKSPHMAHREPNMLQVQPGGQGELGWRFTQPGTYYFGCLQPGHFEAGMVGQIVVAG